MLLAFILGDERGFNILKTLFSVLFEWFDFKWPFITSGKQYKQAVGTQQKVTITA